jgi:CRISPR-associated protein Cas2
MLVLVSYDVSTTSTGGQKRLRQIAKACRDYGQRVQYSVFEIEVDFAQWTLLKSKLCDLIDPEQDSLRLYYLGKNGQSKVEHIGAKAVLDLNGPIIL